MKKVMSIVLALALLLSLGVVMASAAGSATLVISTDKTEYAPGDTAKVTFALTSNDVGVYGVRFTVAADSVLTDPQVTAGGQFGLEYADGSSYAAVLPKSAGVEYTYDEDGNVTAVNGDVKGVTGTMTLMTIEYKVASDAPEGTVADAVSATVQELFTDDEAFSNITCVVTNASLTVKAASTVLIGDVNGDGVVNARDVTRLRRYLAGGYNVEIVAANSDANGDGSINARDVTRLRRYLAGGYNVALGA